ncbi:hypothetical protein [Polaribacter porphyrae]|uniref:PsbP C-terminal domain-containing protein n=1 Tax=Polaribacter porphyrae TaxID=1137780 RepID=A0A2S7WJW0_9FLAO|nr:hypothetical protein [Polaribacter porphyrae]PQJ77863.1 hypothetical protein BTO18_01085 [Polaribacter porphyrae]
MKSKLFFLFFICVSTFSCRKIIDSVDSLSKEDIKVEDLKEVKVNNTYTISIPKYMKEMKSLNDDASFEYANLFKETYTIVIDEDKEEFIKTFKDVEIYIDSLSPVENYSNFQISSIQENMKSKEVKELTFKIKNLSSKQYEVHGTTEDNIDVSYLIGFVESDDKMFMLMSWTVDDRYKKYKNTFKMIQNSFKLLKKSEI